MPSTIIRYAEQGAPRWGVQFGRLIAPLPIDATSTGELLAGHWNRIWCVEPAQSSVPFDRIQLLAPVTRHQQFICQGVNYRSHIAESGLRIEDFPSTPSSRRRHRASRRPTSR